MRILKIHTLASLLILMSFVSLHAQPEISAAKVDRNVIFGMYSGLALLMDVYYPASPNGYGLIHISGSGWTRPLSYDARMLSHQSHVEIEGQKFLDAGYTLFTINHRAFPRFTYPAAVEDARRAVRYIRHHAERYSIDPDRIGAVGGSSGGHLVLMLAMLDGKEASDDDTPVNRESSKVQCVVARAAPSDLTTGIGQHFIGLRVPNDSSSIEFRRAMEASPIAHMTADDPPVLLIHGDKDDVVPFQLSVSMVDRLQEVGVVSKLILVEGGTHGPRIVSAGEIQDQMLAWMDHYLRE